MAVNSRDRHKMFPDENSTADFRNGVKKILLDFDSSPAICHGLASKISQSTQKGVITKNDVFNCINKLFPENIKYRTFEQIKNNPETSGIIRNLVSTVSQLNVTDNAMGDIQQLIRNHVTDSANERTAPGSQARASVKRKFSECSTEINVDSIFTGMLADKEQHTQPLPFNELSAPVDSGSENCGILISETAHCLKTSLMNPAVFPVDHTAHNKHQEEDYTTAMDVNFPNMQKNERQAVETPQANNNEQLELRSQMQDELQQLSSVQSLHERGGNDSCVRNNRNNEEQGSLMIKNPPDTDERLLWRRRPATNVFFERWYLHLLPLCPLL